VHNEGDEDQDVKELFQQVFKPFWASVPVVRKMLFIFFALIAYKTRGVCSLVTSELFTDMLRPLFKKLYARFQVIFWCFVNGV